MHPYLFRIPLPWGGDFRLPSYGFCIMVGFLIAVVLMRRRARRKGLEPDHMTDLAVGALFAGIVGARLFYVVQFWSEFRDHPIRILYLHKGGLVFYGGALAGLAAAAFVIARRRLPVLTTFDLLASVVPLAHAFGRLGCFLNGCCFGAPTAAPCGVRFPRIDEGPQTVGSPPWLWQFDEGMVRRGAPHSLPVHPTQLYEAAANLLLFLIVSLALRRSRRPGFATALYLLLYAPTRFLIEIYRIVPRYALGLTAAQIVGIVFFAAGLALLIAVLRRPAPAPRPPEA